MASKRRLARIAVMQSLFEEDFRGGGKPDDPQEVLKRNIEEAEEEVDAAFAALLQEGVLAHMGDIHEAMQTHAPQWPLERMDRITKSILLIGTYELLFAEDIPAAVVMNEAIDIAKEFGGEESGKFVNGVLNAIAHE